MGSRHASMICGTNFSYFLLIDARSDATIDYVEPKSNKKYTFDLRSLGKSITILHNASILIAILMFNIDTEAKAENDQESVNHWLSNHRQVIDVLGGYAYW